MSNNQQFPSINSPKISDAVYNILREKIVSKELAQGERLDLNEISNQLKVSKTPVKEALSRLEIEGLIQILPRSGTFVSNPSVSDIMESFDVRRILERFAVELLTKNATDEDLQQLANLVSEMGEIVKQPSIELLYPHYLELDHEFHREMVALSGNSRLREAHERENIHSQMARIRYRTYERELSVAQHEHERIIQALISRDAVQASNEIEAHLQRAKRSLLNDMANANHPPEETSKV